VFTVPVLPATSAASEELEAPANVSVINAEEIRNYEYRTWGEALNSARGFYLTNDHSLNYVGVRGVSLPGDWRAAFEASSFGEGQSSLVSSLYLGRGANLRSARSVFDNGGISFPHPGLDLPSGIAGPVANADGERGYHTFANLIWHDWSFTV
jgi:hypothetical protein